MEPRTFIPPVQLQVTSRILIEGFPAERGCLPCIAIGGNSATLTLSLSLAQRSTNKSLHLSGWDGTRERDTSAYDLIHSFSVRDYLQHKIYSKHCQRIRMQCHLEPARCTGRRSHALYGSTDSKACRPTVSLHQRYVLQFATSQRVPRGSVGHAFRC